MTAVALSETGSAICLLFILLIPCAAAGLALIHTGLGRSRSAAHTMLTALCVLATAAVAFACVGFAVEGYAGRAAYAVILQGKPWNWIASERFFLRGVEFDGSRASLAALFGMFAAGLAALIPLGSALDRWRLGASAAATAALAAWTYPLFAHWVWGGGWLAQLGATYHLGSGYIDSGGSGTIQALGGLTALGLTWVLGPRRGKYSPQGMPSAIPGHDAVRVLTGCLLAWIGWLGLNSAGAILFTGAAWGAAALVAVNTSLSACAATLTAAGITRLRFRKTDASLSANGFVGGLAASSAGCAVVAPAAAILIGIVAGALVVYSVEWLELHLSVDDPGGAISVHGVCGVWGVLAVAFFARGAGGGEGQWVAQMAGIGTLLGFVFPLTYGVNALINLVYHQRVAPDGERQGLDLHELGAGAYPDFMTHNEDAWQR